MSRSAKDATRFTPNTPHAYSRGPAATAATGQSARSPSFQSSTSSAFTANAAGAQARSETPQERVARLRADHLKKRAAQLSSWDKVVLRGRGMADAAHRWTIFGILTFSVLAGGLTVFSAVDMITYNRRKKKEFYKEYQKLWEQRHADALEAQASGIATETQLSIIKQEEEAQEYHAKRAAPSAWQRAKGFFSFKGLSNEETSAQTWEQRKELMDAPGAVSIGTESTSQGAVVQAIEEQRRQAERQLERQGHEGGELDRLASNIADAASSRNSPGKGWFSFEGRS